MFLLSTDISRNRLAKISGKAFINLSKLTYLDISYNKLSALELDYTSHLPKLQTLNISGNIQMNLLDVRPVFQNMSELRSLSIADITNMPLGLFVPLSNLQMLNISGTHLNNETLQILNPLAKLKVNIIEAFDAIVSVNFSIWISYQDIIYYSEIYSCLFFPYPCPQLLAF